MRNLVNILIFFFVMILFTSCEEDFVLERSNYEPKLVINSLFKPGENWSVHISKSRDLLMKDSEIIPIENASVTITEKATGRVISLEHTKEGIYTTKYYPPLPDKTYEITVIAEGYQPVSATSKAPLNANIVNVISDVVDKEVTQVNFQVKDNISNYLIWNFISSGPKDPIDSSYTSNPQKFVQNIVKYNNISNYLASLTTSENNAIAQEGSFTRSFKDNNTDVIDSTVTETKKYLRIMTASQDLYEYFLSMEKFISANNHNSSFSYAPTVYNNIKNGLGIFAGFTEEYKEIK